MKAVSFPGVVPVYLPDLVPGIRASPRRLRLMIGCETELPATRTLLISFILQGIASLWPDLFSVKCVQSRAVWSLHC